MMNRNVSDSDSNDRFPNNSTDDEHSISDSKNHYQKLGDEE
jgi:hypothetical protein